MSEHVHKWKIWVAGYQVDNRCHGDRWIQCKCGEWRSNEQAEVMLNATERLSAEIQKHAKYDMDGNPINWCADILEGK